MKNLSSAETRLLDAIKTDFGYDLSLVQPGAKCQTIQGLAKEFACRLSRDH